MEAGRALQGQVTLITRASADRLDRLGSTWARAQRSDRNPARQARLAATLPALQRHHFISYGDGPQGTNKSRAWPGITSCLC